MAGGTIDGRWLAETDGEGWVDPIMMFVSQEQGENDEDHRQYGRYGLVWEILHKDKIGEVPLPLHTKGVLMTSGN